MALLLAGQLAVCFLNPWTWRLAILPFQTVLFLRAGGVGRLTYGETANPWAIIREFAAVLGPWSPAETKATVAFWLLTGLACLAAVACLLRRRWGHLAILAALTAVSFAMRRNLAAGAVVLTPLALGSLSCWPGEWLRRAWPAAMQKANAATCGAAILLAGAAVGLLVSQRFYTMEDLPWRFGWGASRLLVPLEACEFLSSHHLEGRLWTDYETSSNFHFFTRPQPPVPALTNTWAYPPAVMSELMDYQLGKRPLEEARRKYSLEAVAICAPAAPAIIPELQADANWRLVYIGPMHVVYVRADGPSADLARRLTITQETLDANELLLQARRADPVAPYAIHLAGTTLYHLGWAGPAIQVFRAALAEDPDNYRSWNMLGVCHARRAQGGLAEWKRLEKAGLYTQADAARKAGRADLLEAQRSFLRARDLQTDSPVAATGLGNVGRQLEEEQRGEFFPRAFR